MLVYRRFKKNFFPSRSPSSSQRGSSLLDPSHIDLAARPVTVSQGLDCQGAIKLKKNPSKKQAVEPQNPASCYQKMQRQVQHRNSTHVLNGYGPYLQTRQNASSMCPSLLHAGEKSQCLAVKALGIKDFWDLWSQLGGSKQFWPHIEVCFEVEKLLGLICVFVLVA